MLKNSEAAWNRGDVAAFASDCEDARTTTFVGREVTRGGVDASSPATSAGTARPRPVES